MKLKQQLKHTHTHTRLGRRVGFNMLKNIFEPSWIIFPPTSVNNEQLKPLMKKHKYF